MRNRPHYRAKKRITVLFFILLLIVIFFTGRLVWIQVINNEEYRSEALEQRLRHIKVEPKRGIIYDRNGKELAVSASSDTVVGIPMEIKNPELVAEKLAPILDMESKTIYERITRNASAVYIKRKVSEETAKKLRNLSIKGITFTEESKRYYPRGRLASHILGFAGIDSQGLEGIESSYDKHLRGTPGKIAVERDAAGRKIPEGVRNYIEPQNGDNIYLTIDEVIQYIAERELDRAMQEFNISGGTIIVMNPQNGGILAMANSPDYNPNRFAKFPQKYWRNRAISDSFEPGSTFKIVTIASALEEGIVNENDTFVDPGYIIVSGERIKCWKAGGHGSQTFAEVVENSCNPGFVQVGMRLGKEDFYNYINAFGFGQETNIKLPGEAKGLVYDYDEIGPVELATISFGHGITVTPIQLVTAVSAVANDGMLLKPRLVKEIRNREGELVQKNEPISLRKVITTKTARKTCELLENVVASGTGKTAQIEGYRVGGKTGTAKHYGKQIYDSSFIGIVPIDNPQLVILVVLYDVTGQPYYGSQTAAPIFRNVALDTLRYLDIPPQTIPDEKEKKISRVVVPDVENLHLGKAEEKIKNRKLNFKVVGAGTQVIKQVPLAGASVKENSTIVIFTEKRAQGEKKYYVAVPDLKGLNKKVAINLLSELGLKLVSKGEGKVVKQNIKPGTRVPGGSKITVELRNNG